MDSRPFSSLSPEESRSSNQYKIQTGSPSVLIDGKRKKTCPLEVHLDQVPFLENLAYDLAIIVNVRVGQYDPLLNAVEAWTEVYEFVLEAFPEMLKAGVLQPLVDLDACLHNLTVGNDPGRLHHRNRLMDGGYRSRDEFFRLRAEGRSPREPSKRAVRSYRDRQEGRVLPALGRGDDFGFGVGSGLALSTVQG